MTSSSDKRVKELQDAVFELLSLDGNDPVEIIAASQAVSDLLKTAIESKSVRLLEDVAAQSALILELRRIHISEERREALKRAIQVAVKTILIGLA